MSPSLDTGGAAPTKDGISPSLSDGTPKAGALPHVLELMKRTPPSRAVSPADLATKGGPGPKHASGRANAGTGDQ